MDLNLKEFPTKVIPGKHYTCYVDICRDGLHFCNDAERRCTTCSDYFNACFTYYQQTNCTQYCMDQFLQNNQNECDNGTPIIYKWLFVAMVVIVFSTFIGFLIHYLRAHNIFDNIGRLCKNNRTPNAVYTYNAARRELDLLSYTDSTFKSREVRYDETVSLTETEHPYDDVERTVGPIVNTTSQPTEDRSSSSPDLNGNQRNEPNTDTNDENPELVLANQVLPPASSFTADFQTVSVMPAEYTQARGEHEVVPNELIGQVPTQQHTNPLSNNSKCENDYSKPERNASPIQSNIQDNDNTSVKCVNEWDCRNDIQTPNDGYKDLSAISKDTEEDLQCKPQEQTMGPLQLDANSHINPPPFHHDSHQIMENKSNTYPKQPLNDHVPVGESSTSNCYFGRTQDQNSDRILQSGNTQPKELYGASHIPYQRDGNCRDSQLDRDPVRELSSSISNGFEALPYENSSQSCNTSGYNSNREGLSGDGSYLE